MEFSEYEFDRGVQNSIQRLKVVVNTNLNIPSLSTLSSFYLDCKDDDRRLLDSHFPWTPQMELYMEQFPLKEIQRLAAWLLHIGRMKKYIKTQKAVTPPIKPTSSPTGRELQLSPSSLYHVSSIPLKSLATNLGASSCGCCLREGLPGHMTDDRQEGLHSEIPQN